MVSAAAPLPCAGVRWRLSSRTDEMPSCQKPSRSLALANGWLLVRSEPAPNRGPDLGRRHRGRHLSRSARKASPWDRLGDWTLMAVTRAARRVRWRCSKTSHSHRGACSSWMRMESKQTCRSRWSRPSQTRRASTRHTLQEVFNSETDLLSEEI